MSTTSMSAALLIAARESVSVFSPSRNPCIVKVTSTRVRHDPYRASVTLPSPAAASTTPSKHHQLTQQQEPRVHMSIADAMRMTAAPNPSAAAATAAAPVIVAAAASALPEPTLPKMSLMQQQQQHAQMIMTATLPSAQSAFMPVAASAAPLPPPHATTFLPPLMAGAATMPSEKFAVVQFKHELCTYQAPFRIAEGDRVIVEADRGEHLGTVHAILTERPPFNVPCRILRHASLREEEQLRMCAQREDQTTYDIQKVSDNLGLTIKIVDTEFYVDGNKLTIFFASKHAVDFRALQRRAFKMCQARIWLINIAEVEQRNRYGRNRK